MKNTIFCKTTSKGIHSFYIKNNGNEYFLFHQDYRKGVNSYYKNGVCLDEATNYSKSRNDDAIKRTMSKILMYVRYAEKEYGFEALKQTAKKNQKYGKKRLCA